MRLPVKPHVTKHWQAIADSHHNSTRAILWLCCHLCHLGSCCSSAIQILHWETCSDGSSSAAFVVLQSSAAWQQSTQAMKIYTSLKSIFRWHLRRCNVCEQGPVVVRVDVPFCLDVLYQMHDSCGLFFFVFFSEIRWELGRLVFAPSRCQLRFNTHLHFKDGFVLREHCGAVFALCLNNAASPIW